MFAPTFSHDGSHCLDKLKKNCSLHYTTISFLASPLSSKIKSITPTTHVIRNQKIGKKIANSCFFSVREKLSVREAVFLASSQFFHECELFSKHRLQKIFTHTSYFSFTRFRKFHALVEFYQACKSGNFYVWVTTLHAKIFTILSQ